MMALGPAMCCVVSQVAAVDGNPSLQRHNVPQPPSTETMDLQAHSHKQDWAPHTVHYTYLSRHVPSLVPTQTINHRTGDSMQTRLSKGWSTLRWVSYLSNLFGWMLKSRSGQVRSAQVVESSCFLLSCH